MTKRGEQIDVDAASKELVEFVRDLVKQWVDFRGHEAHFAEIIRKHRINGELNHPIVPGAKQ